jgi:hypothetical protein
VNVSDRVGEGDHDKDDHPSEAVLGGAAVEISHSDEKRKQEQERGR